jgi:hypothetical protein
MASAAFEADVSYTAVITVVSWSNYTLSGTIGNSVVSGAVSSVSSQSGSGAVINAVFPVLSNNSANLGTAIAAAKASANPVVQLTSGFYSTANSSGSYIAVDAGSTDNSTPYTIKGTGKASSDVLTVGILLANDNVTLQDVKINITDWNKGAVTVWTGSYTAGVSVARSADGTSLLTDADLASNKVAVKDSAITFIGTSNFTSGIYISGRGSDTISITGNTISVTGFNDLATQGILVSYYNPTYTITGNRVASTNTTATDSAKAVGAWNKPASALYIQLIPDDVPDSTVPNISGNILDGVFDFYINARNSTNPYVGIPSLFADKFGTGASIWASTDGTSFYKKLLKALLPQAKNDGYGFFKMWLTMTGVENETSKEQYEITNGVVTAIDYWGPAISGNVYDASGKNINNPGEGFRGRIDLSGGSSGTTWHWTRDVAGTNL